MKTFRYIRISHPSRLRITEEELASARSRATMTDTYERQARRLREEIALLTGRKEALING